MPYGGSGNPYQDLLAKHLESAGADVENFTAGWAGLIRLAFQKEIPDCIHIHWPEPFMFVSGRFSGLQILSIAKGLLAVFSFLILRLRGVRLVYTLHNLTNHENQLPQAERVFMFAFLRTIHTVIAHCNKARVLLCEKQGSFLEKKTVVIPHGNYTECHTKCDRSIARKSLDWSTNETVFVFLGNIRPYKGVLKLITDFRSVAPEREVRLVVAGRVKSKDFENEIRELVGSDKRIDLRFEYIPDEELNTLLSAADAFVVPFSDVLTSGSVILAMSMGLACIVPKMGCLPELLSDTQPDSLIYNADDESALPEALSYAILNGEHLIDVGNKNFQFASKELSWELVAEQTNRAYRGLPLNPPQACEKC